jgi:type I restriction enzyme M protein
MGLAGCPVPFAAAPARWRVEGHQPSPSDAEVTPRRSSEFRAYSDTRDDLRSLGWNTNDPARDAAGQVYDQHECGADPGLAAALGLQAPEHVVVVDATKRIFWVIEAKGSMKDLAVAVGEASNYAARINAVPKQRCAFYTGIAGSPTEGYLRRTTYISAAGVEESVSYDGSPITSLFSREQLLEILKADTGLLADLVLDEDVLLDVAKQINLKLHQASINKDDRAAAVASILLTMSQNNLPDAGASPKLYVEQVNLTAAAALAKAKQEHFASHIALRLPKGEDAQQKYVGALVQTADALRHLNISAAMRSGTDVLGKFYEAFLKYGNAAKDLGIVFTPRHITQWSTEVLPISADDVIYDPTCGTGGFLVSAFDTVRRTESDEKKFEFFRANRIFGIEQQPKIAALAVVNMIFRGDGSSNILDDDALKRRLVFKSVDGQRSGEFRGLNTNAPPGGTRVLMNPPFALKKEDEREYEFVQAALEQMEDGGLLFAVLPAPILVKSGGPLTWRRDRLLAEHTLRAVVSFPEDLVYPVSIDTVGVIIEKGRPHSEADEVLWARVQYDGYAKVKGKRLPSTRVRNDLELVTDDVKGVAADRNRAVVSIPGLIKKAAIDPDDELVELIPQAYLDEPLASAAEIRVDLEHAIREYLSFLIRTADAATVSKALSARTPAAAPTTLPDAFELVALTDLFGDVDDGILKGDIHALNVEDPGTVPVVSSSTDYNGVMGFYDLDSAWQRHKGVITVASNGTPLTSFYHPYEIVAKDDVFVCVPPDDMNTATVMYVITALNAIAWRFSYYRKAYLNKLNKIRVWMPMTASGEVDQAWLQAVAQSCNGWEQLISALPTWRPEPWRALGRRTWNS